MKSSNAAKEEPQSPNLIAAPSFIDLFAGCGGLSLGLVKAGWIGIFAVEKNAHAFKTFSHNLLSDFNGIGFDWPFWLPVKETTVESLIRKQREELHSLRNRIDLIAGGPPCQGFSMAGMRRSNDPRNLLIHRFLDMAAIIRPKLVLLENVKGIQRPFKKGKKVDKKQAPSGRLEKKLESIGYVCKWLNLEASLFGVAQRRSRSFLIAVSSSLLEDFSQYNPEEYITRSRIEFLNGKNLSTSQVIPVREAISDLQAMSDCGGREKKTIVCLDSPGFSQVEYNGPETAYQRILRDGMKEDAAPNSMRLVKHRDNTIRRFKELLATRSAGIDLSKVLLQKYSVKKHSFSILNADKPAPTITSIPDDFIHYCEPRVLTVRELARIQSFPDSFDFLGKYTTGGKRRRVEVPRYTQVANAVPPFIAEVVGMALKDFLSDVSN